MIESESIEQTKSSEVNEEQILESDESLEQMMERALKEEESRIDKEKNAIVAQGNEFISILDNQTTDAPTAIASEAKALTLEAKQAISANNQELDAFKDEMIAGIKKLEDEFFSEGETMDGGGPMPVEPSISVAEKDKAELGDALIGADETRRISKKNTAEAISEAAEATTPESPPPLEAPKTKEELLTERRTLQQTYENLAKQLVEHKMSKEELALQQKLLKGKLPSDQRQQMIGDRGFTDADYILMKQGQKEWTLNAIWKRLGEIDKKLSSTAQKEISPRRDMSKPVHVKEKPDVARTDKDKTPSDYESYEVFDENRSTNKESTATEEEAVPGYESYEVEKEEAKKSVEAAETNESKKNLESESRKTLLASLEKDLGMLLKEKAKIRRSGEKGKKAAAGELAKLNKKIKNIRKEIKKVIS